MAKIAVLAAVVALVLVACGTAGSSGSNAGDSGGSSGGSSSLASSGPGWDAQHVYIGVTTADDVDKAGKDLGTSALGYGNQAQSVKDMVAYVNDHGGLFGRDLVIVRHNVPATADPNTSAQSACADFTQDHHVVVVLGGITNDTFFSCMKAARVPVISSDYTSAASASALSKYKNWVYLSQNITMERLAPVWLRELKDHGYFTGWDTSTGAPGHAPVKVALLHEDLPLLKPAWAHLKSQLEKQGIDVVDDVTWDPGNSGAISNDVVKFRQDGVTHLFMDAFAGVYYPSAAQSQHYFARYAVTTNNGIQPFLHNFAPAEQLRGLMGVGWLPSQDVSLADSPGPNAGQAACSKIMQAAGADMSTGNKLYTAAVNCDRISLFLQMAKHGKGLSPAALLKGSKLVDSNFAWASQFGQGTAMTDLSMPPDVRFLQYEKSCKCVRYAGALTMVP